MLIQSLEYNKDLHLDPKTKKLILGLLNSLLSVVPVQQHMEPESTAHDSVTDQEKDAYIEEVLLDAREYARQLEGIIDPGELHRYYSYLKDYREISTLLRKALWAVEGYRDTAYQFSYKLAELLEEHVDMIRPADENHCTKKRKLPYAGKDECIKPPDHPRLRVV